MNTYWLKKIRKHYDYKFSKDLQKKFLVKNKNSGLITEWKKQSLFIDWWLIVHDNLMHKSSLTNRLIQRDEQRILRYQFKRATLL